MARCDTYAFGNCTYGACLDDPWLPEGLGNGGDWAAHAAARGYQVTMVPTIGAAVSYCPGFGYSQYGHCGTVVDVGQDGRFLVREMNYVAFDQYDERWSTLADVCGFILPPGVSPGQGAGGQGGPPAQGTPGVPWQAHAAWGQLQDATRNLALERTGKVIGAFQLLESI